MDGKKSVRLNLQESIQSSITFKDIAKYLGEENPPIEDGNLGVDNNVMDNTLHLNSSEEDMAEDLKGSKLESEEISLGEMVAKSNEVAEFYSGQIEFEPIKGLPGSQKMQLEHKQKSVLKNKYWERLLKSTYEMSTSGVPKPEHVDKILSLFIANQEKQKKKREEQGEVTHSEKIKKNIAGRKNSRMIIKSPKSAYSKVSSANLIRHKSLIALLNSKGNLSKAHAASIEIKKRIDKLDKITKYKAEDLAIQTKNVLIRMPPYRKSDVDAVLPLDSNPNFFRMLNKCIFSEGLVNKWKSS